MRTVTLVVLISFLTTIIFQENTSLYAEVNNENSNKINVAVWDFNSQYISKNEAETISQRFRSKLVAIGVYKVLEREKMEEILREQGFQMTGCTDSECMVEAGKLLNVRKMITGFVGKFRDTYTLDVRMIDIETGNIERTVTRDYKDDLNELLSDLEDVSKEISGKKPEEKHSYWLWITSGIIIASGAIAYYLLEVKHNQEKDNSLPEPILP